VRRGDIAIAIVSAPGDHGKPRPAVVVQANYLGEAGLDSTIVCLITSQPGAAPLFRIGVEPSDGNGLRVASQIMVDKLLTVRSSRITSIVGRLDDDSLFQLNRTLAFVAEPATTRRVALRGKIELDRAAAGGI
jgi:mRNA interferase MazF